MANHMNCPECEHPFGYSVALIGKTIRCRQCQHTFTVKAPPSAASNPDSKPVAPAVGNAKTDKPKSSADTAVPPPMPAKVVANRDEVRRTKSREADDERRREKEERERQRKADNRRASANDADDDDDDRPRARRDDDRDRGRPPARGNRYQDDDDDRPSDRRERGSDKGTLVGILIGSGVFVALIIGVLGYVLWPKGKKPDDPGFANVNTPNPPIIDPNINVRPGLQNNPPVFNPPVRPNPPPIRPNPPPIVDEPPPFRPFDPPIPKKPPVVAPPPKPNGLSAREEIELGGPLESIAVGGGGKYLCVSVPIKDRVVIFDTEERKIVKEITVAGSVKIAAGKDTLHILSPTALTMERYKLGTFERDASHKFATARNVFAMAMGSDSEGPLVVVALDNTIFNGGMLRYVEPKTYRDLNVRVVGSKGPAFGIGNKDRFPTLFVSNDGKVVLAHAPEHHAEPVVDIYDGMRSVTRYSSGVRDLLKPAGNGTVLLGKGCFYNIELKTNDKPAAATWFTPSLDGDYYVSLAKPTRDFGRDDGQPMLADIWHMGSKQPMLGIGVLPEFVWKGEFDHRRPEGFHQNVFLSAKFKTLTLIAPDDNTRLVTYKVKLD